MSVLQVPAHKPKFDTKRSSDLLFVLDEKSEDPYRDQGLLLKTTNVSLMVALEEKVVISK